MANAVIGALRVNLGLDSAQFQSGLKSTGSELQKFAKVAAVGFAAVAAAGAAAFGAVVSASQRADDHWKKSQTFGVPIEELGRLAHAAEMSGASMEEVGKAMQRASRAVNDSMNGISNAGTRAFDQIGVALKNTDGTARGAEEILGDVAERFASMPDGAQKTALAIEMFGRSGANLIPMLNAGRDGLQGMGDEAERLGLVFDERTGRMAERFNDNLSRMAKATTGLINALGAMLLPVAVAVTDAFVAMQIPADEMIGILGNVARTIGVAVSALTGFFAPTILAGFASLSGAIGVTLLGAIRAVTLALMANPLGLLLGAIAAVVAAAFLFRDDFVEIFGVDIVGAVADVVNRIIGGFVGAYEAVKGAWNNLPAFFSGLGKKAYNSLLQSFSGPALTIDTPWGSWESGGFNLAGAEAKLTAEEEAAFGRASATFDQSYNRNYLEEWGDALSNVGNTATDTLGKIRELSDGLDGSGTGGGTAGSARNTAAAADEAATAIEGMGNVGEQVTSKLASGFTDMFEAAITGGKSLMEIVGNLLRDLGRMLLNQGFQALLSGGLGGFNPLGWLGNIFGGFRANGGPVMSGRSYIVGEKGPELFTPGASGNIVPNHKLGERRPTQINLVVQEGSMFEATVRSIAGEGDVRVAKTIERNFGGMLADHQQRNG